jgi:hypothetical protein
MPQRQPLSKRMVVFPPSLSGLSYVRIVESGPLGFPQSVSGSEWERVNDLATNAQAATVESGGVRGRCMYC